VDVVLERNRNPVQRTAHAAGCAFTIAIIGLLQRVRIDVDRRLQRLLIHPQPGKIHLDELVRTESALLHCLAHLRDRGFDERERLRRRRRRLGAREHSGQPDKDRGKMT
jgi:hypothetical protein